MSTAVETPLVPPASSEPEVAAVSARLTHSDPLRELYRKFFDRSEKKRRWNVETGIPWEKVKYRAVDEDLVSILESFYATEMFLPDYSAKLIALNRNNQGMGWFMTNWAYEESKHSIVIEEWFLRSGRRSQKQLDEFNATLLSEEWELPFQTGRQMTIYAMFQELATQYNYINLSKLTGKFGDAALQKLLLLIASDEGNHHLMMADCVKVFLARDREGTLADIALVLQNFTMPAHDQIPGWKARGELIERYKVYSGMQFAKGVMFPTLKRLDVPRSALAPYWTK